MSRRTAEERLQKYLTQYCRSNRPECVRRRLSKVALNAGRAFAEQVQVEDRVRRLLEYEPVLTVDYVKYLSFARELGKACRISSSMPDLRLMAEHVKAKWQRWGCRRPVLDRIGREVFEL